VLLKSDTDRLKFPKTVNVYPRDALMHYVRTLFEPLISAPPTAPTAQDKRRRILLTLQDEEERVLCWWRFRPRKKKNCVLLKKNKTTAKPRIYILLCERDRDEFVTAARSMSSTAPALPPHSCIDIGTNSILMFNSVLMGHTYTISDLRTVFCRFLVKMFKENVGLGGRENPSIYTHIGIV